MNAIYRPLDHSRHEIRLLHLRPAASLDSPLCIRLIHASLDNNSTLPAYEALSYAWGQLEGVKQVWVEEEEGEGEDSHTQLSVLVTPNLDAALRSLRYRTTDRVLWVDALCINQADTTERSRQVAQMRRIYECCVADLAWLGPEAPRTLAEPLPGAEDETQAEAERDRQQAERTRKGLQLMRIVAHHDIQTLSTMLQRWRRDRDGLFGQPDLFDIGEDDGSQLPLEAAYAPRADGQPSECGWLLDYGEVRQLRDAFHNASLWSRVWVVQELSCAPRVLLVVGTEEAAEAEDHVVSLDWDAELMDGFLDSPGYADAFHSPWGHGQFSPAAGRLFARARALQQQRSLTRSQADSSSSLIDVLARFKQTTATDPRDKIYGLLGLVVERSLLPPVDYAKSAAAVFGDAALAILHASGCLDVFSQSPFDGVDDVEDEAEARVSGLPSWVPNFDACSYVDAHDEFSTLLFAQRGIFAAGTPNCRHLLPLAAPIVDARSGRRPLRLRGTILGRLGPLKQGPWTEHAYHTVDHQLILSTVRHWAALYLGDGDSSPASLAARSYGPTGEPRLQAFWRTVTADCTAYPICRLTADQVTTCCHVWHAASRLRDQELADEIASADDEPIHRLDTPAETMLVELPCMAMLRRMLRRWAFAQTEGGEDGEPLFLMVRAAALQGQLVAILDGSKVPVLLEADDGGGSGAFRFVGTAYVHGFMDGEAVAQVQWGERAEREIVLV